MCRTARVGVCTREPCGAESDQPDPDSPERSAHTMRERQACGLTIVRAASGSLDDHARHEGRQHHGGSHDHERSPTRDAQTCGDVFGRGWCALALHVERGSHRGAERSRGAGPRRIERVSAGVGQRKQRERGEAEYDAERNRTWHACAPSNGRASCALAFAFGICASGRVRRARRLVAVPRTVRAVHTPLHGHHTCAGRRATSNG
jgi:hypothetical protein